MLQYVAVCCRVLQRVAVLMSTYRRALPTIGSSIYIGIYLYKYVYLFTNTHGLICIYRYISIYICISVYKYT